MKDELIQIPGEKVKPDTQLKKLEQVLFKLNKTLDLSINKLARLETELHEAVNIIDNILIILPQIRKLTARLDLEKALIKYNDDLYRNDVNRELINFVVQKRREIISNKSFKLNLINISEVEKKLGIFSIGPNEDIDIFSKFRLLLTETKDLNEIEVIVRKVRKKLETYTPVKTQLEKDEIVKDFVNEAGFEEKVAVAELLLHENLENAIRDDVVTTKKLNKELRKIQGGFSQITDHIISTVNKKLIKIEEEIETIETDQKPHVVIKIFLDYLISPVANASGALGIIGIIIYILGKYGAKLLGHLLPTFADVLNVTNIPLLCQMLNYQVVFITCFGLIILGGFLKIFAEKIKNR